MTGAAETATARRPVLDVRSAQAARTVILLACVLGVAYLTYEFWRAALTFPNASLFASVIVAVEAVIGFFLLRLWRPVHNTPMQGSLIAFAWGAMAATAGGVLANQLLAVWAKATSVAFATAWSAALTAPLNEEVMKAAGTALIALAFPALIRGPIDGMAYGTLVGLGFQVVENLIYGINTVVESGATAPFQSVIQTMGLRIVLTGLGSHWTMAAVTGAGIGFLAAYGRRGAGPFAGLLLLGMAMHFLFDSPLLSGTGGVLAKTFVNFVVAAIVYFVLRRRYRHRVTRVLDRWTDDGATTADESAALFTRGRRRKARRQVPHDGRPAVQARQTVLLHHLDQQAADT